MRNEFTAAIMRKMEQVAVSPRWISGMSRKAGIAETPARARIIELRPQWVCACTAALLVNLSACSTQGILRAFSTQTTQPTQSTQPTQTAKPAHHGKKPDPKPEPTEQELFEYIREKLLSLSPNDGINDNLEVAFDPASSILVITQPDGHCDILLSSIDTNSVNWEIVDPSETYHQRGEILRLTLTSLSGKKARVCYDNKNRVDAGTAANRVRLLFSLSKADAIPGFTGKMGTAMKKLIVQSGGPPEKDILSKR